MTAHAQGQDPISGEAQGYAGGLHFDRMELAGAFGDLGTLVPFLVAYVSVVGVEPAGMLLSFGLAMIGVGLWYRTPFPVQPMKAIGAAAVTQAAAVGPGAVYAATAVTGALWLLLGVTGLAHRLARLVSRPVVLGIVLGLGMAFMVDGVKAMSAGWGLSAFALLGTLLLLNNRVLPAMLLLLAFGALVALVQDPALLHRLAAVEVGFRLPSYALAEVGWEQVVAGTLVLALPQLPLTLGNAVVAITAESNRLYPSRLVSERRVAISTGIINLLAAPLGGVPMCHGAGGLAGHVRFGARTGGAPVLMGGLLVVLALFFSGSVGVLLAMIPKPVLGVILFLAGAQLALGTGCDRLDKRERFVFYGTAAFALWNVGAAFVFGLAAQALARRGVIEI